MPKNYKIGVIGAGTMGKALIRSLLHAKVPKSKIWAATKSADSKARVEKELGIQCSCKISDFALQTEIIILAIKPKQVSDILHQLESLGLPSSTLLISIAAGTRLQDMQTILPSNPIIRAMPNTPCLVDAGVTALAAGPSAQKKHLKQAQDIFAPMGLCIEAEEKHFDAITAISGCAPAYFYLILEAMVDGAVAMGINRSTAMTMIRQTMLGSAKLVEASGKHPAALKDEVTTPAGCTIGALLVMEDGRIRSTLAKAIETATNIAKGLGKDEFH